MKAVITMVGCSSPEGVRDQYAYEEPRAYEGNE